MGRMREVAAGLLPRRRMVALVFLLGLLLANNTLDVNRFVNRQLLKGLDAEASAYLESTRNQAFVAFGVAKTLNALISLLQDCEVSVTPLGLGIAISVGEVLDPVNDLVERASWVFLASTVSSSIQQVVFTAAKRLDLRLFANVSLLLLLGSLFVKDFFFDWRSWGIKILVIGGILRLSVPLLCLTGQFVTTSFLGEYERDLVALEAHRQEAENLQNGLENVTARLEAAQEDGGDCNWYDPGCMVDKVMVKMRAFRDIVVKYFDKGKEIVMSAGERVVKVITMFVIRVMILPLAWLWLTLVSVRYVVNRTEPFRFETRFREKVLGPRRTG